MRGEGGRSEGGRGDGARGRVGGVTIMNYRMILDKCLILVIQALAANNYYGQLIINQIIITVK